MQILFRVSLVLSLFLFVLTYIFRENHDASILTVSFGLMAFGMAAGILIIGPTIPSESSVEKRE